MCGIVAYTGKNQVGPILLDGLKKLEYRGYDSVGIAVEGEDGKIQTAKTVGRVQALVDQTRGGTLLPGFTGIGHTRWATHGSPDEVNAHPHSSGDGQVVGVHNGIIENYQELKTMLEGKGYTFESQTDTEVAIKLVHSLLHEEKEGPLHVLAKAMLLMQGSYALALLFSDRPGEIYAARKDSPMVVAQAEDGAYLGSDVPAILSHSREVYYIDDMEICLLRKGEIRFYNVYEEEIHKDPVHIDWDAQAAEKGGFLHFMLKEIFEQPRAVRDTLHAYVKGGQVDLTEAASNLTSDFLASLDQVQIVACGSSYHVGMAAQYLIEDWARVPVRVEMASEFRYRRPILTGKTLVVVISQSGETADSLAALREAKAQGVPTLGIINVIGSSIAREADGVLYTKAGPEIAVATTKAYSAQLVVCYLLGLALAQARGQMEDVRPILDALEALPGQMDRILAEHEDIQYLATQLVGDKHIFYIGRGIDYAIAMEASLKMKEISYIHSEAYAAGELKHGTISLVEEDTLVVGSLTQPRVMEKTWSNLVETRSRGALLLGLTMEGEDKGVDADYRITIPETDPHIVTSLAIIPFQLLAYYISVNRGLDVDKPRNLAKSVTVE